MTHINREELAGAVKVLENRCAAIDQHYARFPNSLDQTMAETAKAMRTVMAAAALRQSPSVEEVARRTCHCQGVDFGSYEAQVELVPPDFLRREDGRGICIDVCLALEVTQLWRQGIRTTGCCCGHGKLDPTICVAEDSIPAMRALGYTSCPLMPYRADVFAAKTGWPARKVADLFQGRGGG